MSTQTVEHPLGPVDQIPIGEGREFRVAGRRIAVFRLRGGRVAATQADCPHRSGPLADGTVGMDTVVCPLHAWRFCLSTGEPQTGECPRVAVYPLRVDEAGELVVELPRTRPEGSLAAAP
jgi:nitrite reductase (NADH) small subunit